MDPDGSSSQAVHALAVGSPVVVDDVVRDRRFASSRRLAAMGVASSMAVPLGLRASPVGVLVACTAERRAFALDEVVFARTAANMLSLAIEGLRGEIAHRHAELHDRLTGLANRVLAADRLSRDAALAGEAGTTAVLVLDWIGSTSSTIRWGSARATSCWRRSRRG